MTEQLQKKIDRAIKLLQSYNDPDNPVEVAYSGGKDSDVILQLAKEAGIAFRAIYKNTTIDPPGTIAHAKEMGAEVIRPKQTFLQIIAEKGYPGRFRRFCCAELKEYKVLNKSVIGVRKAESAKRAKRYNEPTECRWYGAKTEENHVEAIYPILEWTDEDVAEFVNDRRIKCHPLYYDDGVFNPKHRLGCMACPLKYYKQRIEDFKQHPKLAKAWIKAGQKYLDDHPDSKVAQRYKNAYEYFYRDLFITKQEDFDNMNTSMFGKPDYKQFLEDYFNIKL